MLLCLEGRLSRDYFGSGSVFVASYLMGAFSRENSCGTVYDFSAGASAHRQHVERSPFFVERKKFAHFLQRVVGIMNMSNMEEEIECYSITYEYNEQFYDVEGTSEIHARLGNDVQFFEEYVLQNNSGPLVTPTNEVVGITSDNAVEENHFKWTKPSTMLLVNAYKEKKEEFRNPKIKKRTLWTSIKVIFLRHKYPATEDDLDRKWRNMKKTYTGLLDNKKSTGRDRISWDYFEDFEEIYEQDKSVNIPKTISSPVPTLSCVARLKSIPQINMSPNITNSLPSLNTPSTSSNYTNAHSLNTPSTSSNYTNVPSLSGKRKNEIEEEKINKRARNKDIYHLRKGLVGLEEKRVEELRLIRKAIEENNKIQAERNEILKKIADK